MKEADKKKLADDTARLDAALGVVKQVCDQFRGNIQEHTQIQASLKLVKDYADIGIGTYNTIEKPEEEECING